MLAYKDLLTTGMCTAGRCCYVAAEDKGDCTSSVEDYGTFSRTKC
jgi:dienelactone hydrolase